MKARRGLARLTGVPVRYSKSPTCEGSTIKRLRNIASFTSGSSEDWAGVGVAAVRPVPEGGLGSRASLDAEKCEEAMGFELPEILHLSGISAGSQDQETKSSL